MSKADELLNQFRYYGKERSKLREEIAEIESLGEPVPYGDWEAFDIFCAAVADAAETLIEHVERTGEIPQVWNQ